MLDVPTRCARRYTVVWNAVIKFSGPFSESTELCVRETELLGQIFFRGGDDVKMHDASKTAPQCHCIYMDESQIML